ncbi:CGNR zinc finger domain-containing protein [Mesorhizobium sp. L2C085B000]|uniref:CGNR zinc finger domain-containing protein n=1 Tax=Mesorhizobium sp. L2C085B000 TaxID=1287117 RepID=UPI0012DEB84A|nr:CGNR zinc finger domain-containing protein [Mesorhizobium sp. L2C085B000]
MLRFIGSSLRWALLVRRNGQKTFISLQRPLANTVPPTDVSGMDGANPIVDMRMVGGHPCLDFVNTVDARRDVWGPDLLQTYADLVVWAGRADLIDVDEARALLAEAPARPLLAEAALEKAKILREAVYAALQAEAAGARVPDDALQIVRDAVALALPKRSLFPSGDRLAWQWTDAASLNTIGHRVAFETAEFLVSRNDRRRVRECTGPNCGWLFIDTSRGGRRRWCSDESCGTRSRVRRFRAKAAGNMAPDSKN